MKVKAKQDVHDHVLDEFDNQYLMPNKIYGVIGLNDSYYRIIDENGDPILYPKYLFEVVDPSIPESWVRKEYEPDDYYIDPPELSEPGFYEDYFDGEPRAREIFEKFLVSSGIQRKGEPRST